MNNVPFAAGGAVAAAFASCLCCLGPLMAVALGFGAAGAAVEPLRPYLLTASALALSFGFRRVYVRPTVTCGADGTCKSEPTSRMSRIVLWVAAFAVLTLGLVPYVVRPLGAAISHARTQSPETASKASASTSVARTTLEVKGMTCAACETIARLALERTSGVVSASVSFARGEALVDYDPARVTPAEVARELSRQTGYEASPRGDR